MRSVLIALLLGMSSAAHAKPPSDCASGERLDYVCRPEKPEDVLAIPGTKWLIASGFAPGAGLKLVDTDTRNYVRWYRGERGQIRPDKRVFPNCPGPVDATLFNARGLSLRRISANRWRLLVVNHGGRQSIEIFDVDARRGPPRLQWRGCLLMPDGQVGNSVASFADGTILVTVLTRPGTTIADFVAGKITGGVWQWRPGETAFGLLPGTELPGNNGLETDPDERHFYVIAFGWHALVVFDRTATQISVAQIEAPDFMPDNIHWSDGRLLLAGMRLDEPVCGGQRKIVDGVADPMTCHRGWVVGEVDPVKRRITTLAYGQPEPSFNGVSAATIVNDTLWLGSYQSDRLATVSLAAGSLSEK